MDFSFAGDPVAKRSKPSEQHSGNGSKTGAKPVIQIPSFSEVEKAQRPSAQPNLFQPKGIIPVSNPAPSASMPSSAQPTQPRSLPIPTFNQGRSDSSSASTSQMQATSHGAQAQQQGPQAQGAQRRQFQWPQRSLQQHDSSHTNMQQQQHSDKPQQQQHKQQCAAAYPLQACAGSMPSGSISLPSNAIVVSRRQEGNPVLKHIRNVRWQFGEIVPDYVVGQNTCVIFLSLRYHLLHPDYLIHRIKSLLRAYPQMLVLCHVDSDAATRPLGEITKTAIGNSCTLICAWSPEECARYLETLKAYESKPASGIQERVEHDYLSRLTSALTSVHGINRTDAGTLSRSFHCLADIMRASPEELSSCPGIGPTKVHRLTGAFNEPFRKIPQASATAADTPNRPIGLQGSGGPKLSPGVRVQNSARDLRASLQDGAADEMPEGADADHGDLHLTATQMIAEVESAAVAVTDEQDEVGVDDN